MLILNLNKNNNIHKRKLDSGRQTDIEKSDYTNKISRSENYIYK